MTRSRQLRTASHRNRTDASGRLTRIAMAKPRNDDERRKTCSQSAPYGQSFSISSPMPEFEAYGINVFPTSRLILDPAVRRRQLMMLYVG